MASTGAGQVDAYLAHLPEPQRATLTSLRATLRVLLPTADEAIKYAMPALLIRGKAIAGYAGFAQHCSYFPHSSSVLHLAGDLLDDYATSKGGLRFPPDRPFAANPAEATDPSAPRRTRRRAERSTHRLCR